MSLNVYDVSGDLGMGRGLKPGSMNNLEYARKLQKVLSSSQNINSFYPSDFNGSDGHCSNRVLRNLKSDSAELENLKIEIEILKQELDSVLKKLHSKQQAIQIFQQQLLASKLENEKLENKLSWFHGTLIKDFNSLQFKVEQERQVTKEFKESCDQQLKTLQEENKSLKELLQKQDKLIKESKSEEKETSLKEIMSRMSDNDPAASNQSIKNHLYSILKLPDEVDCDCYSLDLRRCPCSKLTDQLVKQLKQLIIYQVKCPQCFHKYIPLQSKPPYYSRIDVNGKKLQNKLKIFNLSNSLVTNHQNKKSKET